MRTEVLFPYPGVSTKQRFLSKTESPMLFLRLSIRLSSKSDHQAGYAFVLAYTSVICNVLCRSALPFLDLDFELFRRISGTATGVVERGST